MAYFSELKTELKRNQPKDNIEKQEQDRLYLSMLLDQVTFGFSDKYTTKEEVYKDYILIHPKSWVDGIFKEHKMNLKRKPVQAESELDYMGLVLAENKQKKRVK